MRFTWTGLLVAPLLVPALFSALFLGGFDGFKTLLVFLVLMIPTCIISYGTTIFLFLPCLFVLSKLRRMTGVSVCLLGLVLGAVMFVPVTYMDWQSSGPDSGPPTESFFTFLPRWAADPLTAVYPLAGLITAGSYWWIGTRRLRQPDSTLG